MKYRVARELPLAPMTMDPIRRSGGLLGSHGQIQESYDLIRGLHTLRSTRR